MRHTFTKEDCSKGYHAVIAKYPWGRKFLRKRMFNSYGKSKRKRNKGVKIVEKTDNAANERKPQKHRRTVHPSDYQRVKVLLEKYPNLHRPEIGEMAGYCASVITDIALTNSFEEYALRNERRSAHQPAPQVTDKITMVDSPIYRVIEEPEPGVPLSDAVQMIIVRLDKIIDAQYKLLDAWNRA